MNKNVGGYDRIGRFVVDAVLLVVSVADYAGLGRVVVRPVPRALWCWCSYCSTRCYS